MTDWRFFATAKTAGGVRKNQTVNWKTNAVEGKLIEIFSDNPQEGEVMIAPPAFHHVKPLRRQENPGRPDYPYINLELQQKAKP
jgi:hypothetical protein